MQPRRLEAGQNSQRLRAATPPKANVTVYIEERVPGGSGWGGRGIAAGERTTDYASLAPTVYSYPIGSFFWSLMVKPAYLRAQRLNGTVNGLFWPDGAVTSLKDARAIANDPKLVLRERPIPPDFTGVAK